MRFVIISDTHFGDPMCSLIERKSDGSLIIGSKYNSFKNAAGKDNDYLILVGDILDFSIVGYKVAYDVARHFFFQIQKDNVAKEIIYIPGNHDADLWHIVEHEINIIYQVKKGRLPKPFRMSVPGVIDDRKNSLTTGFTLPGISQHADPNQPKYSGLFLDNITRSDSDVDSRPTYFNFVYPNLYIVTDNECILVTHGHYLEPYWSFLGEFVQDIAKDDLNIENSLNLKQMVGINFPLNQFACTGLGQAQPLTDIVCKIQREVKDGNLNRVKKYLNRAAKWFDKITKYKWYDIREWIIDLLLRFAKKIILKKIKKSDETRYCEQFIYKKEVRKRFWNFYYATLVEIKDLNLKYNFNIPNPWYVIFGHTHCPIPWQAHNISQTKPIPETNMKPITLFNAGGWLFKNNSNSERLFKGAEVFIYDSETGFRSTPIN